MSDLGPLGPLVILQQSLFVELTVFTLSIHLSVYPSLTFCIYFEIGQTSLTTMIKFYLNHNWDREKLHDVLRHVGQTRVSIVTNSPHLLFDWETVVTVLAPSCF